MSDSYVYTMLVEMPHGQKLSKIREINHFALHRAQGQIDKRLVTVNEINQWGHAETGTYMEVNFTDNRDATLFKLGYVK